MSDQHPYQSDPPSEGGRASEKTGPSPAASRQQSAEAANQRQALLRLSSAGFELASFSLLLGGAGYALDYWLANAQPYFAITGILLGFCLGFYRLIVLANKMN